MDPETLIDSAAALLHDLRHQHWPLFQTAMTNCPSLPTEIDQLVAHAAQLHTNADMVAIAQGIYELVHSCPTLRQELLMEGNLLWRDMLKASAGDALAQAYAPGISNDLAGLQEQVAQQSATAPPPAAPSTPPVQPTSPDQSAQ